MRASFSLAAVAGVALLVGCGGNGSEEVDPSTGTADGVEEELKAAVIGEEMNNQMVDVTLGRSFTIALSDNAPSSGYKWMIESVDKTIGAPKESYKPGPAVGSAGLRKFRWTGKSPLDLVGRHEITLVLQRAWAELSRPAKTFKVTVNIVDPSGKKHCGSFAGMPCADTEYCEFGAAANCGIADHTGTCVPKPKLCPAVVSPVCGCDGRQYNNSCIANAAGIDASNSNACIR